VRYDVFPGAMPLQKARLIGQAETFEQLALPEPPQTAIQTNLKKISRTKQPVREIVYVPYEEGA
jgi:hypothetical protein